MHCIDKENAIDQSMCVAKHTPKVSDRPTGAETMSDAAVNEGPDPAPSFAVKGTNWYGASRKRG